MALASTTRDSEVPTISSTAAHSHGQSRLLAVTDDPGLLGKLKAKENARHLRSKERPPPTL
eukprot:gene5502-11088_t